MPCIGNPSSAVSGTVTNAAATESAINSGDPAWAHCIRPDLTKKHSLVCKYCDKVCNAGITRIKYHLAGIKGFNVTKCEKIPTPVQKEMFDLLTKKTSEKEQKNKEKERDGAEVDLDYSDSESGGEEDGVLIVNPKLTSGSSGSKSVAGGGPIDRYYKPPSLEVQMMQRGIKLSNKVQQHLSKKKVQATLTSQKREASIAHNSHAS